MNILELDSYNLADAVKFNDQLNPRIWQGQNMRPEVREKLLAIAADFKEFLGLSDLEVKDITVSGSNAAYTYTPQSDIDLHLVVDIPRADSDEVYRELFDAKKYQYNDMHNIKIGGYDVELYVENANKPPVSQGVFSVMNNDWINIPRQRKATVDDDAVRSKYEDIKHRIDAAIDSNDIEKVNTLAKKIKAYRQAGLDKHGELGPENLAYKMLRNQGYIEKLYKARAEAKDRELSLSERKKKKKPVKYGFARTWGPVFDFGDGGEGGDGGMAEDVSNTPDGVSPSTKMFLSEKDMPTQEEIIRDFLNFAVEKLEINDVPRLRLKKDPAWSISNKSFGRYDNATGELIVALGNRHIMDILRTLAHELTHRKQDEREDMPPDAGETGSPYENEAHARAGMLMRDYAAMHPEYFEDVAVNESSGYIPTQAQADDPRFKMALTVDVHPGQTGREANKMALKTDKQGKPALLIKSANLLKEYQEFKAGVLSEDEDLFEVKMTSGNLAKLARDIKGVKVGLEFEMIVPNTDEPGDSDMEADYDQDDRVRDIDDCVNFFDDGDYNSSGQIRRLRDQMYEDFYIWRSEMADNDWYNSGDGFEYFKDYLDREEPFDEEDAEQEARNELQAQYGDELSGEDFDQMLFALVDEKRESYVQDQWDEQGRNFDDAREEYTEERIDDYSEQDWLENQGIRYASDVESNYGDVTWPYYTSSGSDDTDVKQVALNFMNAMGMRSVAVSDSYHGNYQRWNGSEWVDIGRNKPDDCFAIEPDGSLEGNDVSDAGLEFVSPPIPLEDIGTVMKKVQAWAADNGVYTGKSNKTSIHTNISVPGYDIKNLDYLKAALLLGDEYVLREFDRIGNSYAKPAIEKVRQLVNQKPEKAQELLDKMKSQLNAEASKLLHSGVTDKFTSINTKDNRIEFRSPGGDYLSIIADDPQKMIDTINRMVVTMDAAIDPNKYKEEYQKKLYKMLTGQQSGREATSGLKREPKKETNDLLNIFSRYAAGELPKAALKSFVRQAQLERKLKKGETGGQKYWWNVQWDNNRRIEVVAGSKEVAKQVAAEEWGVPESQLAGAVVTPLRPYTAPPAGSELERLERQAGVGQQSTPNHNWAIRRRSSGDVVRTFYADDYMTAHRVLQQYKLDHNITDDSLTYGPYNREDQQPAQQTRTGINYEIFRGMDRDDVVAAFVAADDQAAMERLARYRETHPGAEYNADRAPVPGSTIDLQRQRAAQTQQNQGNWGIWIIGNNRFANQPGTYARGAEVPLYRFPSQAAAESWLEQQRAERAGLRTDIEVREIEPARQPVGDINLFPDMDADLARARAADAARGGIVDVSGEQPAAPTGGQFTGEWKIVDPNGREIYRFSGVGNAQSDANRVAMDWLRRNPQQLQAGVEVLPVMG